MCPVRNVTYVSGRSQPIQIVGRLLLHEKTSWIRCVCVPYRLALQTLSLHSYRCGWEALGRTEKPGSIFPIVPGFPFKPTILKRISGQSSVTTYAKSAYVCQAPLEGFSHGEVS